MGTSEQIAEILNECYPDSHSTWNTGGGCTVEVWRAPRTGALWTLADEYIAVHSSEAAFWGHEQAGGPVYSIGRWLDDSSGDVLSILTQIEDKALKGYANRTLETVTVWAAAHETE